MSLVNLAHVCSHLQNASKARLGLTSIPQTNLHLTLALGLQKQGFLSSVTLGGPSPPLPSSETASTQDYDSPSEEALAAEPWLAYPIPGRPVPGHSPAAVANQIPKNVAQRRLWLGLKYWNNEPVLREMKMVSKPTKRIWLNSNDLGTITRGRAAGYVKGMTRPGECLFISTDRGVLEARDCVERRIGGMLLCRVV